VVGDRRRQPVPAGRDPGAFAPEVFTVGDAVVYLHLPGGMGHSKLAVAVERAAAKQPGTTRNWNTVLEIERLLRGAPTQRRSPP
jgi:uncharacterized protein (DUF1697 family)